ncbi:hypothetical protein [Rhodococcoides kyotonense]|nr:hypothetical protein [Rhodococcus kyotonensis]
MNSWSGRIAMMLGGVLVGSTLAERDMGEFGPTLSVVVAAIVAACVVLQVRSAKAGSTTVCVGAAVLVASMWSGSLLDGVGAGLILGGLLALADTDDRAWLQSALATGVVVGARRPVEMIPRRYADYLSDGSDASDGLAWVLLVATVVAVLWTLTTSGFGQIRDPDRSSRVGIVVIGVGIPLVALLTRWWFAQQLGPPPSYAEWVAGGALVAAVVAAAFVSRETTGVVLLAGLAVSVVDRGAFVVESRWFLVFPVAAAVVGSVVGRRWPAPVVGFGMLALVTVPTVFDIWVDPVVLLPVAVYLFASCLPSNGALTAVGVLGPLLLFVPFAEHYGWTAITAIDNRTVSSFVGDAPAYDEQALAAVVTILLCGVVAWTLTRHANQNGGGR